LGQLETLLAHHESAFRSAEERLSIHKAGTQTSAARERLKRDAVALTAALSRAPGLSVLGRQLGWDGLPRADDVRRLRDRVSRELASYRPSEFTGVPAENLPLWDVVRFLDSIEAITEARAYLRSDEGRSLVSELPDLLRDLDRRLPPEAMIEGYSAFVADALSGLLQPSPPLTRDYCCPLPNKVRWIGPPVPVASRFWHLLGLVLDAAGGPVGLEQVWVDKLPKSKTVSNTISEMNNILFEIGIKDWCLGLKGDQIIRKPL
jgi:hypothetical protein